MTYRPKVLPLAQCLSWFDSTGLPGGLIVEVECTLCLVEITGKEPTAPERLWSLHARGRPLKTIWPRALDHLIRTHGVVPDSTSVPEAKHSE